MAKPKISNNCPECDQPMLPAGEIKRENEYDHARGCPLGTAVQMKPPTFDARRPSMGERNEAERLRREAHAALDRLIERVADARRRGLSPDRASRSVGGALDAVVEAATHAGLAEEARADA